MKNEEPIISEMKSSDKHKIIKLEDNVPTVKVEKHIQP